MNHSEREARMLVLDGEVRRLEKFETRTNTQDQALIEARGELRELQVRRIRNMLADGSAHTEGGTPFDGRSTDDDEPNSWQLAGPNGVVRDRALRTIERAESSGQLPDYAAERATALINQGGSTERGLAARWAAAAGDESYLSAFAKLVSDPTRGHLLWTGREQEAYRAAAGVQAELERSMSTTGNAGGYMIPLTLDPAILLTSAGSINPLRRISRVEQTVTNAWQGVSSAGVTAEWKTEASEVADASPALGNPSVPVYFGDAFVPYSFEVGQDATNFLEELRTVLLDGAEQLMATAYTTGTGSGQPTGIIQALVGGSSVVNSAVTDTFASQDVFAVQNALPPRFSSRAQWCANIAIINKIRTFETTNGSRLYPELADGMLLGKPVNELSNMDGTLTASAENYLLLYGDFTNFLIVDRIGTTLELIPNLIGTNRRPTGQRGALLWFRTGADSLVDNAFRLLDVT
jgi:HK97 family phage major capsid protein